MNALLDGLKALGPLRLVAMAAVALGTLGLIAMLALHGGGQHMALLYNDLDLRESAQIVEQLDKARIAHQIGAQGAEILVPADQVVNARLLLAKDGLPSGGSVGYEIFDRADPLTASQAQIAIDQTRALEGELTRTIRAIHGVRAARVHLVLPRREPFAREEQPAQASVLLTMSGSSRLDKQGVQAVVNLVAAAVPGLRPQNIAIIDSRGDLLARAGEPVGDAVTPMNAEEIRRTTELRLSRAVEEMLERSLGPGHVRAEAAVEMSFNRLHETEERYDPDGQVVRSQQSTADNSRSTENNNTVSVQNNLPNTDAGQNGSGSQEQKQEETTNYEISKTVRTLVNDAPEIKHISLAVMVDGVLGHGPDGKPVWQERGADELARITALVKSAIGFDDKRGDKVEVASLRFAGGDDTPAAPVGILDAFEKADLMRLAQTLLFGIVGVLTLLLVLRPMVLRLTATPVLAGPAGAGHDLAALPAPGMMAGSAAGRITTASLTGMPLLEDESMVDIANIEGQMRASSIRRIAEMVEKHPDESIAIVRGWMAQEQH